MAADAATRSSTGQFWHTYSIEATLESLAATPDGLSQAEADARLQRYGANTLPEGAQRSVTSVVLGQFSDVMILVLIAAAIISGLIGDLADTLAIAVIILLNATIGIAQELRAERAIAALRKMAAPIAHVRRGSGVIDLPAEHLVPGDIVLLEAGLIVPADVRMLEAFQLRVSEAALTGESHPVDKSTGVLSQSSMPIGDRSNMAWKGTQVTQGRGTGVVVATGLDTELGRIARLLGNAEPVITPLQRRLARFSRRIAWAVLAICALVLATGLARGEPALLIFLTAVSLAVAAIPEALPAVVAITLALGAAKMVKQHALVRRLSAVETLGSITYICSDKTGTLTQNRMVVEVIDADGAPCGVEPWPSLLRAITLANDAVVDSGHQARGDPTEIALLEAAVQRGIDQVGLTARHPRCAEIPFDSERKRMATVHTFGQQWLVCVKGAPEAVVERCAWRTTGRGLEPCEPRAALAEAERMAAQGLRVLAVGQKLLHAMPSDLDTVETELTYLGLVGLMDPPRAEAAASVAECRAAGIVPVMITGDHPATARAISQRLGIPAHDGRVLSGTELSQMDDADLARAVRQVRIYARVDPEQKIRIVEALQAAGEFVAMTGDGVNDAPALKRADIGVAMGLSGTDVAREAAHMVLLDDNFASIVHAVREGRRIYDNIRRFIKYAMTGNSAELGTIFLAPFLGLPIPLLPIHILWINLVTDGLPGLALAAEPAERGVMQRPPRPPTESVFARGMWQHIIWVGMTMAGVCLLLQAWALHTGSAHWQTMVFTVLCLSQLGHALAIRSERESIAVLGLRSNTMLLMAIVFTLGLQLATIYVPALNAVFKTEPLDFAELVLCLALSSIVFLSVETEKWLVRRGVLYREAA